MMNINLNNYIVEIVNNTQIVQKPYKRYIINNVLQIKKKSNKNFKNIMNK